MKYVIENPDEAQAMREALRVYEYNSYGWQYFARNVGKIEGIRCHRFLNNSSLIDAKREVESFLSEIGLR
jgi:hypothetical protein